jgi:mRNA-degrading endonuclease YafQ of YafQ-DinJ toxin-antitoxin module
VFAVTPGLQARKKRDYDMDLLAAFIDALLSGAPLDPRFRDHQ